MYRKSKGAAVDNGQSLIGGALILTIGTALVKIIGAIFKLPLGNIIGESGMGYFSNAYSLYLPVYTIATGGIPLAIARLVSENKTKGNYNNVRRIHSVSKRIFLVTGIVGTLVMICIGLIATLHGPYNRKALWAIMAMCPSVFFCCMMSAYRGYNEGLRNMVPTAVSQVIEALGKLFIGLTSALAVVSVVKKRFLAETLSVAGAAAAKRAPVMVFGTACYTLEEALNACYPFATACALLGITLGSAAGMVYLIVRYKITGSGISEEQYASSPEPDSRRSIFVDLLKIGIPIALGVLAVNLTQLIDSFQIQAQLLKLDLGALRESYGTMLSSVQEDGDIPNFLWGAYNYGINIYNLVPYIAQALGVSALPALAAAWVAKDKDKVAESVNQVFKVGVLLVFPAGMGIFALAPNILALLYPGRAAAVICAPMLRTFGIMALFGAMAAPLNSMLQAVGKQMVPVKLMLIGAVIKLSLNYVLVGIQSINIKGAPFGSLACYAFIFIGGVVILCRTASIRLDIMSTFIKPLLCASLCGLAAWGCAKLLTGVVGNAVSTVVSICFAVVVYVISVFLLRAVTENDILSLPKGKKIAKTLEKYRLIV